MITGATERSRRLWSPQERSRHESTNLVGLSDRQYTLGSDPQHSSMSGELHRLSTGPSEQNYHLLGHLNTNSNPSSQHITYAHRIPRSQAVGGVNISSRPHTSDISGYSSMGAGTRIESRPLALPINDIVFSGGDRRRSAPALSEEFIALARTLTGAPATNVRNTRIGRRTSMPSPSRSSATERQQDPAGADQV